MCIYQSPALPPPLRFSLRDASDQTRGLARAEGALSHRALWCSCKTEHYIVTLLFLLW